MRIEGGQHREHEETGEKDQYRRYYLDDLDQYAGQCPSKRLEAEGEEAKDAVYTSLQFIRDQREPVAELHDIVDRASDKANGGYDT